MTDGRNAMAFEAGQVWEYRTSSFAGERRLIETRGGERGGWWCHDGHSTTEAFLSRHAFLVSPAPKPGQRWKSDTSEVQPINVDGAMAIEQWYGAAYGWIRRSDVRPGSVVTVARWLLENGYHHVEAAESAKPRVELRDGMRGFDESTIALVAGLDTRHSAPPPWTRELSRCAVDAAVVKLRGEPFWRTIQAVLVACADTEAPTQRQIEAVIAGCRAWEKRRGEVAPGRRELTEKQRIQCAETANTVDIVPFAWGDIYERARSASDGYRSEVRQRSNAASSYRLGVTGR
jgi:hypothetical protein